MCLCITGYYCYTLNSSVIIFPPNFQTIIIAQMLSIGGEKAYDSEVR